MIAVIDLDGTIINSTKRHYALLENILARYNTSVEFDHNKYLEFKRGGHNNYDFLTQKLKLTTKTAQEVQKRWVAEIEAPEWLATDVLYLDALTFLQQMQKNNYTIICLSARQNKENLEVELKRLKIDSYPQRVIVVRGDKTDALRELSARATSVMIGDTEMDFIAAEANNLKSYLLNRGFRSRKFLLAQGAETTYVDLSEVSRALGLK